MPNDSKVLVASLAFCSGVGLCAGCSVGDESLVRPVGCVDVMTDACTGALAGVLIEVSPSENGVNAGRLLVVRRNK